jgi:double-stranded uracil-DNA glycosylase
MLAEGGQLDDPAAFVKRLNGCCWLAADRRFHGTADDGGQGSPAPAQDRRRPQPGGPDLRGRPNETQAAGRACSRRAGHHAARVPAGARPGTHTLILGSFPSEASLAAGQYYAHPRNQFWRLLGATCLASRWPRLRYRHAAAACWRIGSASGTCSTPAGVRAASTPTSARRAPNDFAPLRRRAPGLQRVLFNGATAGRFAPRFAAAGVATAILPSSSPAHASRSFEQKLVLWRAAFGAARRAHPRPRRRLAQAATDEPWPCLADTGQAARAVAAGDAVRGRRGALSALRHRVGAGRDADRPAVVDRARIPAADDGAAAVPAGAVAGAAARARRGGAGPVLPPAPGAGAGHGGRDQRRGACCRAQMVRAAGGRRAARGAARRCAQRRPTRGCGAAPTGCRSTSTIAPRAGRCSTMRRSTPPAGGCCARRAWPRSTCSAAASIPVSAASRRHSATVCWCCRKPMPAIASCWPSSARRCRCRGRRCTPMRARDIEGRLGLPARKWVSGLRQQAGDPAGLVI